MEALAPSLAAAFTALPEPAYVLDGAGRIVACSVAGARALGRTPGELAGRHWGDVGVSARDVASLETTRARVVTTGTEATVELAWPG
ncbi:PAS domain-containing protein, partial [Pyxidicoccus sp. 3LFB2]